MRRALEGSPLRRFERTTPHPVPHPPPPATLCPSASRSVLTSLSAHSPGGRARSHLQRWVLGCGTERPLTAADSGTVTTCPAGPRCVSPLEIGRFGSALRSAPGRTRPTGAPSSSRAPAWETRLGRDVLQEDGELQEGGRPGDLLPREEPLPLKDGSLLAVSGLSVGAGAGALTAGAKKLRVVTLRILVIVPRLPGLRV